METKAILCMILFCLLDFAQAQQAGENIWDMLINDNTSNGFEGPITYQEEPVAYQQAPVYREPIYPIASSSNVGVSLGAGGSIAPFGALRPKVELLKLAESFVKLQGEVGSKFYALVVDNWEVIKYLFNTLVNNIGTLQLFTLNGIVILRKILEFAYRLFSNWQITVPNVNVDFSTLLRESDFFNEV